MKTKPLTALHQDSRNPLFPLLLATFVVILSVTCFASYSFGVDEVQLKKLLALGNCAECDLSGADLREANLNGADLSGAKLREANLSGAKLNGANLLKVDLREANLSGANLREADLTEVNLSWADLGKADLKGAVLRNAKIFMAIFCNTKTPWGLDNSGCK